MKRFLILVAMIAGFSMPGLTGAVMGCARCGGGYYRGGYSGCGYGGCGGYTAYGGPYGYAYYGTNAVGRTPGYGPGRMTSYGPYAVYGSGGYNSGYGSYASYYSGGYGYRSAGWGW